MRDFFHLTVNMEFSALTHIAFMGFRYQLTFAARVYLSLIEILSLRILENIVISTKFRDAAVSKRKHRHVFVVGPNPNRNL